MKYEEIKLIKQTEKSTVLLVREKEGTQLYVQKKLAGQQPVYQMLQNHPHPCLPKLHEVIVSENSTTIIEEYIEAQSSTTKELSEKQFLNVVRQLCSVLEYLHGNGIIHRDIKPSNILITEDMQVYLIDFDAARSPKADKEQDTKLLGTKGFAPPEQYGFSQTDERTDIYALGATLECLLEDKRWGTRYKKIIHKCMNLDPDKRYQSVRQVRHAFFHTGQNVLCGIAALCLLVLIGFCVMQLPDLNSRIQTNSEDNDTALTVLPVPGNPHWDGETGIAVWDNVPESGVVDEFQFSLRLYRRDTETPPEPDDSDWYFEDLIRIGGGNNMYKKTLNWNVTTEFKENGIYYFALSAVGDGIQYTDSPYTVSDAFVYTGESALPLPAPTGLRWKIYEEDNSRLYYATWDNLDDYDDKDSFNVTFYDKDGNYVMNNTWTKSDIVSKGYGGISIRESFLSHEPGSAYRFTVQAYSSRPNEYKESTMPDPVPEEYFSPWFEYN
ncbi:MAG: serine/threonine protein kinase [Lachnospiraceae bacterium]|nr:serine/threonine protein kinase [Lachnospiraceae bacterium]